MDPWECYQDTWQTTCSVLEHHRDLMKVSGASLRGGWAAEARRGRGKGAAGLQPQFRLWSLAIRGGEPHEGGRGTRNLESARGCSCLARPAGSGLGRFAFCQQVQGGLKETIGRKLQNVRREGDQPRKKSRRSGDCGGEGQAASPPASASPVWHPRVPALWQRRPC